MLKVIFLCQHKDLPSTRIRIFNLLPILEQEGIKTKTVVYPKKFYEKIKLFRELKRFDIVILQKKLITPIETIILRNFSRKLLFDFDDAIYINDDSAKTFESRTRQKRFKEIIKIADAIIAGNPHLAKKASEYNKNIFVLPSAVFTKNVPTKIAPTNKNIPLILGWVGGGTNLKHLDILSPTLKKLSSKIPFKLHVISDKLFYLENVSIENIPWDIRTQDLEITKFDVGLMPLPKNPWTEGKCSYKALQYMAGGVVPVASRFGFNCEVIEDRKTGFLFDNEEEFIYSIEFINNNREKAFEMGRLARKTVEERFSVEVIGKKLASILKEFA